MEVKPILDPDMRIQFLMDSCVAHNDRELEFLSPDVTFQYFPRNTTQILPMNKAVKFVNSFQKRRFYQKLFRHCENNPEHEEALNVFLRLYNILEAIYDIIEGWNEVPHSNIQEDFEQVFPMKKWNELTASEHKE